MWVGKRRSLTEMGDRAEVVEGVGATRTMADRYSVKLELSSSSIAGLNSGQMSVLRFRYFRETRPRASCSTNENKWFAFCNASLVEYTQHEQCNAQMLPMGDANPYHQCAAKLLANNIPAVFKTSTLIAQ